MLACRSMIQVSRQISSLFFSFFQIERCLYDGANPALTMYEVMSGDTLSWKVPSPRQSSVEAQPESQFTVGEGAVKILKVCFCTNNNLGKNFKLVKCDSSWQIRVRVIEKKCVRRQKFGFRWQIMRSPVNVVGTVWASTVVPLINF